MTTNDFIVIVADFSTVNYEYVYVYILCILQVLW